MDDLILDPYSVVLNFTFPEIQNRWEELLSQFLVSIAEESTKSEKAVVGHIKTLTTFSDNQFFRMSVIAPSIPPTTEGQIPPGNTEIEIILNVLVYGVLKTELIKITRLKADEIAHDWKGKIVLQI